jgi:hypothetical protein
VKKKSNSLTACILSGVHCVVCGWPVVDACVNDEFYHFEDASSFDRWQYCSNKGCVNHDGDGVAQEDLEWVEKDK